MNTGLEFRFLPCSLSWDTFTLKIPLISRGAASPISPLGLSAPFPRGWQEFLSHSSWEGLIRAGPCRGSGFPQWGSGGTIVSPAGLKEPEKLRGSSSALSAPPPGVRAARGLGLCGQSRAGSSGGICCPVWAALEERQHSVPFGSFLCYIGSMNHFPDSSCAVFKVESSKEQISLKYTQSYFLLDVWALLIIFIHTKFISKCR